MDKIEEIVIRNGIKYQQNCFTVFFWFVNCYQDGQFINAISKTFLKK